MRYLVDSAEMRRCDENTSKVFHVPPVVLMERAALAAVAEMERSGADLSRVLVACGSGNNGGDGYAIARLLFLKGCAVDVVEASNDPDRRTEANRLQRSICEAYGIRMLAALPGGDSAECRAKGSICAPGDRVAADEAAPHVDDGVATDEDAPNVDDGVAAGAAYTTVVDALLGVGLSREVGGRYAELINEMNKVDAFKVAIDIPSGISADDGALLGVAFRANLTITFGFEKAGFYLWPGADYCGEARLCDIGIDERSFLGEPPSLAVLEDIDLSRLPRRPRRSHKGTFGTLLVIAGSAGMAGAAYLSASAAYACGCGLVRILSPKENRAVLQAAVPEAVFFSYGGDGGGDFGAVDAKGALDAKGDGDAPHAMEKDGAREAARHAGLPDVSRAMEGASAIVCGPGIGTSGAARSIVLEVAREAGVPVVFDADALNALSCMEDFPELLRGCRCTPVLTPHPGEMSRLTGKPVKDIMAHPLAEAGELAGRCGAVCVLKDAHTVTAGCGGMSFVNLSGNDGMATAGSGDVLSGVIGSLLAQGMQPGEAAPLGVFLHGRAGDEMAPVAGRRGLVASDLIEGLRRVLR